MPTEIITQPDRPIKPGYRYSLGFLQIDEPGNTNSPLDARPGELLGLYHATEQQTNYRTNRNILQGHIRLFGMFLQVQPGFSSKEKDQAVFVSARLEPKPNDEV